MTADVHDRRRTSALRKTAPSGSSLTRTTRLSPRGQAPHRGSALKIAGSSGKPSPTNKLKVLAIFCRGFTECTRTSLYASPRIRGISDSLSIRLTQVGTTTKVGVRANQSSNNSDASSSLHWRGTRQGSSHRIASRTIARSGRRPAQLGQKLRSLVT